MDEEVVDLRGPDAAVVPKDRHVFRAISFILLFMMGGVLAILWYLIQPPAIFPTAAVVEIPSGENLRGVGEILQKTGVIRSPLLFRLLVQYSGRETGIQSGSFLFSEKLDLVQVTKKMLAADRGIVRIRITIPEGSTLRQFSQILSSRLPNVSPGDFLTAAAGKEGYVFPDTYFFYMNATSGPIVDTLSKNFVTKTAALKDETMSLHKDWGEIIIMASLIEEEAVTDEDRKIVSGILWSRIKKGMKLQVDAPFVYLMNKSSSEISLTDLSYDSPYNTYLYKGLPPGPITNPGIKAIDAALHPEQTDYLYYLSDKDGHMHYAKTFEEHKLNKEKYLR